MKVLLNPDNGAPIKDFTPLNGETFFTNGDRFEPGTVFQFEDDRVADRFLQNFGFLQEITPEDAKKFMEFQKLVCKTCGFTTRVKTEYDKHLLLHEKEKELSELGIPVIKKQKNLAEISQDVADMQKQIDAEDRADGLTEGAGLTNDQPIKNVVMS